MGVPRKRRETGDGDGVLPVTVVVVAVAVLAVFVVLAVMGLPTETIIALSSAAVLTAAELVRRLVSAVSATRRRR
ncbi:hypothetical protein ACFVSN_30785 [Kitasatospora sp. NPDC057904]|uniref:hypothetical protein n=1 Tax=unclassified Kitasatospora TaxID=2633591 RepID=UPI0036DC84CA